MTRLLLVALAILFWPATAGADTWMPPETRSYHALDGEYRLTIVPSPIESSLNYFTDEIAAEREGRKVKRPVPLAVLERREDGGWTQVWVKPLLNAIAPVNALIAPGGTYTVTFDNWHSVGHGDHVLVIYGADGELVRSFRLDELLSAEHISALPATTSSVSWRNDTRFIDDGEAIELSIIVPPIEPFAYRREFESAPLRIALTDGAIGSKDDSAWTTVRERIEIHEDARVAAETALRTPLSAPSAADADWQGYADEAYKRLTRRQDFDADAQALIWGDGDENRTSVLRTLIEAHGSDGFYYDDVILVAPADQRGVERALRLLMTEERGTAGEEQPTFYIGTREPLDRSLLAQASPAGLSLVPFDLDLPISQTARRIPGTPEHDAYVEEFVANDMADFAEAMTEIDMIEETVEIVGECSCPPSPAKDSEPPAPPTG